MTKKAARLLPLGVLAAWLLLAPSASHADNWPRFRGPNGTGVANDRDVPVQFDDKTNMLWKVSLPGTGHSSPVVWGDRLFLQTALGNAKARQLLCLDAVTGKRLWARDLPGVATRTKIHKLSSYASSTPAVDGQCVYLAFWDGIDIHLRAFDLNGNQLWTRNLGYFKSQHGPGASPVVYLGKVYFANDQDDSSTLYCLDCKSGKTVWQKDRPAYRACYSAPFLLEKPGRPAELVVVSTLAVTGYEPHQGTELWNWVWKHKSKMPLRTTASPAYANGMLLCCSGDGGGDRYMIGVKLGDNGASTEPKLAWGNDKKECPYVPTPLVRGDHFYFVNDKGFAGCYELKTGKKVWMQRLPNVRDVFASPVLIDGKIYAISDAGDVFVIAAEPTYRLLATNSMNETVRATPAVANNRLYIRGQNHLFCIAKK